MPEELKSKWDGLSKHLLARFYPVERITQGEGKNQTSRWEQITDQAEVHAPITDGTADHTANWNSPFENMGMDQRFSSFSALLQSGSLEPVANIIDGVRSAINGFFNEQGSTDAATNQAKALEGKTGVTKLNSMQIYNGSPPSKITVTVHFRAYSDPYEEVERPINQLIKWALPRHLAYEGAVGTALRGNWKDLSLYPSQTPQIIAMKYAGMLFSPLVIESAPYTITGPRDSKGFLLSAQMQLTLGALTAIDAEDWDVIGAGGKRIKM
jgi:hypothetical protein